MRLRARIKTIGLGLTIVLLTGCSSQVQWSKGNVFPQLQPTVVDYSQQACQSVWSLDDQQAINNALYWLRLNQCKEQLPLAQLNSYWQPLATHWQQLLDSSNLVGLHPTMEQLLAASDPEYQQWLTDNAAHSLSTLPRWAILFKQNILAGSLHLADKQRLQLFDQLSRYQAILPASVKGIYQLWQQQFFLWRQQQNNRQLRDSLKEKEQQLAQWQVKYHQQSQQLMAINHKLASLAEIEKQLSSRKLSNGMVSDDNLPLPANNKAASNTHSDNHSASQAAPAVVDKE